MFSLKKYIFLFIIGVSIGLFASNWYRDTKDKVINSNKSKTESETESNETNLAKQSLSLKSDVIQNVRILCLILTCPKNHAKNAIHVKNTWGSRCNKLIFISTVTDNVLGSVGFNVTEGHAYLWGKTKEMFQYVYRNFYNDYDWFYKADDDTYAVMENMRFFLSAYSPDDPIYFGHKFNTTVHRLGYFSGGSGYVLSREALRKFNEEALTNASICKLDNYENSSEDWEMGLCLQSIGVYAGDSRDQLKRDRFFPFTPEGHLFPVPVNVSYWYWERVYYKTDEGLDCCSNYTISFHYISPVYMYALDFLIYSLQVYGIELKHAHLPTKLNFSEVAFILEQQKVNSTYFN